MSEDNPRVVFDCNIFVQALANEESDAAKALNLFDEDAVTLFVSDSVLDEIRDVLNRAYIRQLMPNITDQRVAALFQRLERKAIHIKNVPEEFRYERDPKDERYINLALVTNARYLVSKDKDLLDLMKPLTGISTSFFNRYPMLRILKASAFLKEIEEWRSEQL
ncbi:MAG: putative toxin-antitoxin system toxin component, PIN family [Blastocatellia bacterium]